MPNCSGEQLAVAPDDTVIVVWDRSDGSHNRIQARTIAADGTPGTTQTLSAAGQDALAPLIAIDSVGKATVSWERWDGSDYRVQAAQGP